MCGIVGLWNINREPINQRTLDLFTDTLAHRGPDGRGTYVDDSVSLGLGHRRLAIIDVSETGRQPMSYAQGRYWITYNGEIYNFIELRRELMSYGYTFISDSDTEVILAAFDKWGLDCQFRFNGMWAFAVWDSREQKLFLSRDRFGVKPLHYFYDGRHFAFASEMKAFLALDWFPLHFDAQMVATALQWLAYVEGTERTLIKGLKRLPAGHSLTVKKTGDLEILRWWNTLDHLEDVSSRYHDQVEHYRELFLDACRIRMRSDVALGTALSGGLDSSSVLCGMKYVREGPGSQERLIDNWQNAFIATYPGTDQDEKEYADIVVQHTKAIPIYCQMEPGMVIDLMDDIIFHFEELSDIHIGPWVVYKTQRQNGVVVSLDGHGGDECLGGYYYHVQEAMKDAMMRVTGRCKLKRLNNAFDGLGLDENVYRKPTYRKDILEQKLLSPLSKKALNIFSETVPFFGKKLQDRSMRSRGTGEPAWLLAEPLPFHSRAFGKDSQRLRGKDLLFKELFNDFHYYALPTNLRDFDRLSMAHGVEVRSPFMDWRLVCYTFSLPAASKMMDATKRILRDAMTGILPEKIRTRTYKVGFSNPGGDWSNTEIKERLLGVVQSREFLSSEIWDGRRILREIEAGYATGNSGIIQQGWKFAQAMQLINLFKGRQKMVLTQQR